MTTPQGRVGRRGRSCSWLSTALLASGFCLAGSAARPALACHLHHHDGESSTTAEATHPVMPTGGMDRVMQPLDEAAKPMSSASSTPSAMVAAPQVIAPSPSASTTSVPTWHQTTANACMPPTPPCTCGNSPSAASQSVGSTPPLNPPAPLLNPTAAPEPSTLLTAAALAGAFAWRRRATRVRA